MPVPKSKENIYGKIVGHLQNLGYSLKVAKEKTDKAIKDHPDLGAKRKKKPAKKKGK
jgi:hypothetical protein